MKQQYQKISVNLNSFAGMQSRQERELNAASTYEKWHKLIKQKQSSRDDALKIQLPNILEKSTKSLQKSIVITPRMQNHTKPLKNEQKRVLTLEDILIEVQNMKAKLNNAIIEEFEPGDNYYIFQLLDSDCDGYISHRLHSIDKLSNAEVKLIQPILVYLKQSNTRMHFKEFKQMVDNI